MTTFPMTERVHTPRPFQFKMLYIFMFATGAGLCGQAFAKDAHQLAQISVQATQQAQAFSGNMDLVRSENDAQAYQIISRKDIENSGATSVDELFQRMATMATSVGNDTAGGWTGASSQINLRGLGASHTLVLINGRRGAGIGSRGSSEATDQQNINSIPIAAIERIEILPGAAAALYGSSALGGVINVVLRRDYVGTEANIRYNNTFDSDTAHTTVNLVTGFALEEGKTRVMFTAQKEQGNELKNRDRFFAERGRATQLAKNPALIYDATNPPMGNLTNIKTKDGSELIAGTGKNFAYVPKGYQGASVDGLAPFMDTVGQYALGLANGIGGYSGESNLVGEKENLAFQLNMNRDFNDQLNVFLDTAYEEQHVESAGNYHGFGTVTMSAKNKNNPFGKDILITYSPDYADALAMRNRNSVIETTRAATGFEYRPTETWKIIGDYAWTNSRNDLRYQRRPTAGTAAFNAALADGSLDLLRDVTTYPVDLNQNYWAIAPNFTDQTTKELNLRSHAPIYQGYAGDIYLATGVGQRKWESEGRSETGVINNPNTPTTLKGTTAESLYAELNIPLISDSMNLPWADSLELQLAGRHERYKIDTNGAKFDATSPTAALKFAPNKNLILRASYAEGFIVPTASQLGESQLSANISTVTDPLAKQKVDIYTVSGGNPEIEPETAKSIGAGFVFTPASIPDLRWSVDYFKIRKSNNITSLSAQTILDLNAADGRYTDRIERDVDGNLLTVTTTPFNALWLETSGIDTQLSYSFSSAIGLWDVSAGYTWTEKFKQQTSIDSEAESLLNQPANEGPLSHRLNASAYLQATDAFGLGWNMQYYGEYDLNDDSSIQLQGSDKVGAQQYHDVFARYKLGQFSQSKVNTELTFGIKNLFNHYEKDLSETYVSKYTDPRLRQYFMNLKVSF